MKQLLLLLFLMGTCAISGQQNSESSEDAQSRMWLHPNPAQDGFVYVESEYDGPKHIRIYDLFGKVVLEVRLDSNKLLLTALVPGVYMVQVRQQDRQATKKLVIR